jgi:hypothetical protein
VKVLLIVFAFIWPLTHVIIFFRVYKVISQWSFGSLSGVSSRRPVRWRCITSQTRTTWLVIQFLLLFGNIRSWRCCPWWSSLWTRTALVNSSWNILCLRNRLGRHGTHLCLTHVSSSNYIMLFDLCNLSPRWASIGSVYVTNRLLILACRVAGAMNLATRRSLLVL